MKTSSTISSPDSSENIFTQTKQLLAQAPAEMLDKIASSRRDVRQRAIQTLVKPLDEKSKNDVIVYQALALQMAYDGDSQAALSYIETLGMLGHKIDMEVVEKVYEITLGHINAGSEQGKGEFVEYTNKKLALLFTMFSKNDYYKSHPRFGILQGQECERIGDTEKAILYYNMALEQGEGEAFFLVAKYYKNLGQITQAENILRMGWQMHQERVFLEEIVRLFADANDIKRAKEVYQEMIFPISQEIQEQNLDELEPFCMYSERIENDGDLRAMEKEMAVFAQEGNLYPSDSLCKLAKSADLYIKEKMHGINESIAKIVMLGIDYGYNNQLYFSLVLQRLYYAQVHLIALKNPLYFSYYLGDMNLLTYGGTEEGLDLIREHFENNPALAVDQIVSDLMEKLNLGEYQGEKKEPDSIYDAVSEYVAIISKSFLQGEFYELHKDLVVPLLRKGNQKSDQPQEDIEEEFQDAMASIKAEADYFDSISPDLQFRYHTLIHKVDNEYGMFFRRELQISAREALSLPIANFPKALKYLPDLAMLYLIEKVIADTLPFETSLVEISEYFDLLDLRKEDVLLLSEFWMDVNVVDAIEYLVSYPQSLDSVQGIYILINGLKKLSPQDVKLALKGLHEVCRLHYHARGFFDHIRKVFGEKLTQEISDTEMEKILLSQGNLALIRNQGLDLILSNFQTAVEFGSTEAMIQSAELYEETGYFQEALELYQKAYLQDSNIGFLSKIVGLCIRAGFFDTAQSYITLGMQQSHDFAPHIFSLLLWQGKTKEAMQHAIWMISEKKELIDLPEGTLQHLYEHTNLIFSYHYTDPKEEHTMKILASFILTRIMHSEKTETPLEELLSHWQCIQDMINELQDIEIISPIINETIGIMGLFEVSPESTETQTALQTLHYYAYHLHQELQSRFYEVKSEKDLEETIKMFNIINFFITNVVSLLEKFPDSKDLISTWKKSINFMVPGDMIIVGKNTPQTATIH